MKREGENTTKGEIEMSLRQIAKILGVSHTLLSLMKNGKREWRPDLKERYEQLVTSLPESGYTEAKTNSLNSSNNDGIQAPNTSMVELRRLELLTPYLQSRCSPS